MILNESYFVFRVIFEILKLKVKNIKKRIKE